MAIALDALLLAASEGMERMPAWEQLQACRATAETEQDCAPLYDRCVFQLLSRELYGGVTDDRFGLAEVITEAPDVSYSVLVARLRASADGVDQAALLAAFVHTPLREMALPDDVVARSLEADCVPASTLALDSTVAHAHQLSGELARDLADHASDTTFDSRLRERAVLSLRDPASSAELVRTVSALRADPEAAEGASMPISQALAGCGARCGELIEDMLSDPSDTVRSIALRAAARLSPTLSATTQTRVRELGATGTSEERELASMAH